MLNIDISTSQLASEFNKSNYLTVINQIIIYSGVGNVTPRVNHPKVIGCSQYDLELLSILNE
jgi:hypothetical protein